MTPTDSGDVREVSLFRNRRNQAVRIPVDFAFDVDRVRIRREGNGLLIEPVHENGLLTLLDGWQPLDEDLAAIADTPPAPEEVF